MLQLFGVIFIFFLSLEAVAGVRNFSFGVTGSEVRPAFIYIPELKKPTSLLVVFHGGSRNALSAMNQDSDNEWNQIAESRGWVALYPSGTTNQKDSQKLLWNDCRLSFGPVGPVRSDVNDVEYLDALIKRIMKEQNLDEVFLTGHSNGAGMVYRMAMESSLALTAIAPMLMNLPRNLKRCKDRWVRPIPTALLLGTGDPMVSFSGGTKGRSGKETLEWIRSKNGAILEGKTITYNDINDTDGLKGSSSTIKSTSYETSDRKTNVLYFVVDGGGHQVPGPAPVEKWMNDWLGPKNRDLSVREEISAFFQSQVVRERKKD
ncbi:MAG: hypothetical protein EOP04_07340 [Proteobacteria bacterium]|nr:MAG: hypothetical protein EOP04_07340 [Pseudomonadota bacterium]